MGSGEPTKTADGEVEGGRHKEGKVRGRIANVLFPYAYSSIRSANIAESGGQHPSGSTNRFHEPVPRTRCWLWLSTYGRALRYQQIGRVSYAVEHVGKYNPDSTSGSSIFTQVVLSTSSLGNLNRLTRFQLVSTSPLGSNIYGCRVIVPVRMARGRPHMSWRTSPSS